MVKRQPTARPEQQPTPLRSAYDAFILSRQAQNVTARTLTSYTERLSKFLEWRTTNQVSTVNQITGATARTYLVYQRPRVVV